VITKIPINTSGQTGVYYDEGGRPMQGSALMRDSKFQDRVVAETLALLAAVPAPETVLPAGDHDTTTKNKERKRSEMSE
jgi:hypothetical protein